MNDALASTVSGGSKNTASGYHSVVSGGESNTASNDIATVGGGASNTASGGNATVGGGASNTAGGTNATVGGGGSNTAYGIAAAVPGGYSNQAGGNYSFAGGLYARVRDAATAGNTTGDQGTFIWSDSLGTPLYSTGQNQFLVRATGGVGINTNAPAAALDVNGNILASAIGLGTTAPNRPLHIRHTGAAEINMEVSDAQASWKVWNLIAGGSPTGQQQNFTFRILTDDATGVTKDIFVLGYTGNATLHGTLTQLSDVRLKTDILPLEGALDKVTRLRGVSYRMKDDKTNSRRIGVIAQELETEYPELVATDDKGMKSVAYANMTPVLIEAMKALKAENEELKTRLTEQERIVKGLVETLAAGRR
jgi:hypothetical protein